MVDNPFRRALLVISVFAGLASVVLFAIGVWPPASDEQIYDPIFMVNVLVSRVPALLAAAALFWLGMPAFLLWLYFSAKQWTPSEKTVD